VQDAQEFLNRLLRILHEELSPPTPPRPPPPASDNSSPGSPLPAATGSDGEGDADGHHAATAGLGSPAVGSNGATGAVQGHGHGGASGGGSIIGDVFHGRVVSEVRRRPRGSDPARTLHRISRPRHGRAAGAATRGRGAAVIS
jgi:hypothetical protein